MSDADDRRSWLADRVRAGELTVAPGVFDMVSARIADRFGFDALYATGYGISASHLGVPDAGIATYTEPLGRMRRGIISREQVWKDLVEGTPKGQPQAGDLGLNRTNTWGRTYWGGAIYCLLADIEIRKRSENRFGLEHALRGIMESGANAESDLLSAPEILTLGDLSTRNSVLTELYEAMKETPVTVDLSKIWQELGITVCGDSIKFDDNAPLANIRKAIENGHDRGELASR